MTNALILVLWVGGGLAVYGSSSQLSSGKLIYAALLAVLSVVVLWMMATAPAESLRSPVIAPAVGVAVLSVLSMIVGTLLSESLDPAAALRQGVTYLLVPLAPFVGLQLGKSLHAHSMAVWTVIVGAISAVSFAVDWLSRRQVGSLGIERLLLGSPVLSALGFAVALTLLFYGRKWARPLALAATIIIPASLLINGTRTNLILFIVPLAMVGSRKMRRLPVPGLLLVLLCILLSFGLIFAVAPYALQDPEFLTVRARALLRVLEGAADEDLSYIERATQYQFALSSWQESPVFGKGFGWSPDIPLDTPLAVPARIGALGTGLLLLFLSLCWFAIYRWRRLGAPTLFGTAAWGFAAFMLALLPFGSPFEDRGFCLALVLLFAGLGARLSDKDTPAIDTRPERSDSRKRAS